MKRRGFLAALGIGGGAITSGIVIGSSADSKGIYVSLKCCGDPFKVFLDLTKPIMVASPQCPQCLMVMQWPEDVAQNVKAWNIRHGKATTIYTPMRI